jgi:hypothetical protein
MVCDDRRDIGSPRRCNRCHGLAAAPTSRPRLSAAVSAIKVKSVLSGKWIERAEVGAPGEYETMTDDELERAVMERARKLGFVAAETQH